MRYISNYSTGKMGFAIAECLAGMGASVHLVCGPVDLRTSNPLIHRIDVVSADQMFGACTHYFESCDGAVLTAAVADYAPAVTETEKIKRSPGNMQLELRPNRDIAAELGRLKKEGQVLVGFALETTNEVENAVSKLEKKNLDMIVLNSLREEGAGFGFDTNRITILTRKGQKYPYGLKSKSEVARDIISRMLELGTPAKPDRE